MTEKTLTFFRVFDLAFFAPGTVLFLAIWKLGLLPLTLKAELKTAEGAVAVIASIATIYILGLSVHALVWGVFLPLFRFRTEAQREEARTADWIPFPMRFGEPTQEEIILYFWYLRSTCWNVGTAIVLALLLWLVSRLASGEIIIVALGIAEAVLLIRIGRRYDLTESRTFSLRKEEGVELKK